MRKKSPRGASSMDDFLERAKHEMFPKLRASAVSVTIVGEPDPKLCIELGAAILFDKPIVVFVPTGRTTPANLRRVAAAIVEGDLNDSAVQEKLKAAMADVMDNDRRSRQ